jgi:secreted PhoX family phosphatase
VPAAGFADQGEVLVKARQASDALGATKMDRPEWVAIDPRSRDVYCTLTNNSARGQPGRPGVDAANPRANNTMGGVIRWREEGDFDGLAFRWSHLVLAGDAANERADARGNVRGDPFGCPDGLLFDARGLLWLQTDAGSGQIQGEEFVNIGNNQMLACDLATGEIRRFLSGPTHCEVTGASLTPDARTMFVNIQHPGESPTGRSDPSRPALHSRWPDGGARPRSATVAIRRVDGGPIGT